MVFHVSFFFSVFSILSVLNSWLISLLVCLCVSLCRSTHELQICKQIEEMTKMVTAQGVRASFDAFENWSTDMYMQLMPLWFLFAGFLFKIFLNTHSFSKIISYWYIVLVCACGLTKLLVSIYKHEINENETNQKLIGSERRKKLLELLIMTRRLIVRLSVSSTSIKTI